jgi:hypothetical protein
VFYATMEKMTLPAARSRLAPKQQAHSDGTEGNQDMKLTNLILAGAVAGTSLAAHAAPSAAAAGEPLTAFDVAEDLSRFVFAPAPVFDDGMPAYGNAFVTQGYVYPAGTLDGGVEGTLPNGNPAFPDLVIGEWTCDGFFVGDGAHARTGVIVVTRQVIVFDDGDLLITQGPELAETQVEVVRAVTGGTGDYLNAPADIRQTLLGMSDGYGVRLQMQFAEDTAQDAGSTEKRTFAEFDAIDNGHSGQ